jgi:hypothetical protein
MIVRRSALTREVLANFPDVGRLIEFENSLDLVPIIGEFLAGRDLQAPAIPRLPSGSPAYGWSNCAAEILAFADAMLRSEDVEVWRARDRALRYIKSAR